MNEKGNAMEAMEGHFAINALLSEFSWRIDRDGAGDMGDFFTEDGRLLLPNPEDEWKPTVEFRGRAAISARWEGRSPLIATRHLQTNIDIALIGNGRAKVRSVGIGFRHDGPGFGFPVPLVIGDYDDLCRLCDDGRWRFEERRITPVFVDPSLAPAK